ncbi:MAG TPA: MCE family protein [Pseudonocardia sp.]|uniref:MCE family protein n=1 Tax=Pseudonocardia sp. TaxID=60912 RepID=UPI002CC58A6A|nr:MCE family protein [Pseudonocardia sp.]HTF50845.1 MCE family protein [Pseudonocardia sp.]
MIRFSERDPVRIGVIGTAVLVVLTVLAVNVGNLPLISSGTNYTARFAEAGGLAVGDEVTVGGFKVGAVREVSLEQSQVAVRFRVSNSAVRLGDQTAAAIKTATVLGTRSLQLTPRGAAELAPGAVIPIERTTSPYQLTDVLGTLTTKVRDLDTGQLATSLNTISDTLRAVTPDVPAALDGVTRLSGTINARDAALTELLRHAEGVTGVLAERSGQITELIDDGGKLLDEVQRRREVINEIFLNVSSLSRQLHGLVKDNRDQLPPALDHLNSVLDLLQRDSGDLANAIQGLGPFARALGESVASGPWFNAFVPNLVAGNLSPLLDYLPKNSGPPALAATLPSPPQPRPGRRRGLRSVDPDGSGRLGLRRWAVAAVAAVLVVALAIGAAVGIAGARSKQLTVYFPSTLGLYQGDEVRVLGVSVGEVDSITSDGPQVRVQLHYDSDVPVPANAGAALVAQTLVTARFVQLTPVYAGGPVLADGAQIPVERTAVPVDWEQIKAQLSRLTTALGPQGANQSGALSDFVTAGANVGRGQGTHFRETIAALSNAVDTLSHSRGDLFSTVRNLQVFVSALRQSDSLVDEFTKRLASVSQLLNDNRTSLAEALRELDSAADEVTDFVKDNRHGLRDAVDGLGEVTSVLVRQRSELENILHNAPTALANFYNIYDPASGSLTGALAASNFQAPAELVCSGLAHAASHDPEQSTGLCKQYLGPLLNALATNYPPIGVNPIVRDGGVPRRDTAAGPALPAGGLDALALPGAGPLPGDAPLPGASLPGAAGPPVPGAAEPAVPDDLAGLLVPTGGRR